MLYPPVESGERGMQRRNYLVEVNRLKVANYEPTRKALEEAELQAAQKRAEEKREMQSKWNTIKSNSTTRGPQRTKRPLPGHQATATMQRSFNRSKTSSAAADNDDDDNNPFIAEKKEEARKKAEYCKLYEEDIQSQLRDREKVLKKMHDDEAFQMKSLRELNEEQERKLAEADRQRREENAKYMQEVRASNLHELAVKKAERKAQEQRDLQLMRLAQENNRIQAEMEERQAKDVIRMVKKQNEEYHKETMQRRAVQTEQSNQEMEEMIARNAALAKAERAAAEARKKQYINDFRECVERDRKFREENNYDEPLEVTRARNEAVALEYRRMNEEERQRRAERKREYEQELLKQMKEKQDYRLSHIDDLESNS